jgi:ribonuclease G
MPEIVREILIDACAGQTRVALLEDGKLAELAVERTARRGAVGDIYVGRVSRVLPGMQAAFVDLGFERDAFLYVADVHEDWEEYDDLFGEDEERPRAAASSIDDLLKEGQEILVQIVKEPMGEKGARVTTHISLPGRLLVYTPQAPRVGISRRIIDESERERLRGLLEAIRDGVAGGFIARTAAEGRQAEEFEADRRYLAGLWESLSARARTARAPVRLHREHDLIQRAVRDLVSEDVAAIRVNDPDVYGRVVELLGATEPALVPRVRWHKKSALFFDEFGVEAEIEKATRSKVWLKSGGYIVINPTEALVAIDVNSGKFTGRDRLEDTVFAVDLEAAREIARQIRLRDLGGILVIDFIDLEDEAHRRELFEAFEREMRRDRARSRILQLSEFGLIQVTRKRSRPSLDRMLSRTCPSCAGSGRVKSDFTLAMEIRREVFKLARSITPGDTVVVRVTSEVQKLLGQDEPWIVEELERELEISVALRADEALEPARYQIDIV